MGKAELYLVHTCCFLTLATLTPSRYSCAMEGGKSRRGKGLHSIPGRVRVTQPHPRTSSNTYQQEHANCPQCCCCLMPSSQHTLKQLLLPAPPTPSAQSLCPATPKGLCSISFNACPCRSSHLHACAGALVTQVPECAHEACQNAHQGEIQGSLGPRLQDKTERDRGVLEPRQDRQQQEAERPKGCRE